MVYSNALSINLLQYNQNFRSIQDTMRSENLAGSKFKQVCTDTPNLAALTASAKLWDIQAMYAHASIGNKSLGKTVTTFSL